MPLRVRVPALFCTTLVTVPGRFAVSVTVPVPVPLLVTVPVVAIAPVTVMLPVLLVLKTRGNAPALIPPVSVNGPVPTLVKVLLVAEGVTAFVIVRPELLA